MPGHDPDALLDRSLREIDRVAPSGSVSQEKKPPCGWVQRAPSGSERSSAASSRSHLGSYSARETHELLVHPAAANGLLEEPLPERARALVGVLLGGDEPGGDLGRADRPAEPDARGTASSTSCPSGRRRPARGSRGSAAVVGEAELAVGDVLDDQEPVPARELDERGAPLGRETDAGRVLVVGDRVEQLRAQPAGEPAFQLVHLEPVLVERDGDERRLEAAKRLDRAEVGGPSTTTTSPGRGTTWRPARAPRSRRS